MYQNYIKYNTKTASKSTQDCSPLLHYHYVSTLLTMQIPAETLSQSHRLCFIGKERDSETGFSYFGARYYDSDILTGWLSVDPMADKYPGLSPYAYCAWNPIKLVDPDGEDPNLPNPKEIIANAITSSAELAYNLYTNASVILKSNPSLVSKVNSSISPIKNGIEKATDMNPQTMGWGDLVNIWLFELGNSSHINFGSNAYTTMALKNQEGVNNVRNIAIDNIKNGIFEKVAKTWVYGQDQFYDGVTEGNIVTSFLGSYNTSISISQGGKKGEYILNFEVTNTSSWESATRLRKDNDKNGSHDAIIPSKERGVGIKLGGNLQQIWRWSESFNINAQ